MTREEGVRHQHLPKQAESEAPDERIYPCAKCGTMRSKAEGGTVFTVCDDCWDEKYGSESEAPDESGLGQWVLIEDDKPEVGRRVVIQVRGKHYMAVVSDHHHYHFKGDRYNFEIHEVFAWAYIQACSTAF